MAEYESIAESAPHPQPLWRTAYLHMNALLPAAIVFVCLYFWSSVVLAIFLFHGVCLVLFPLLLIALSPRCGRTLEWYYAHIRQKIDLEQGQAAIAPTVVRSNRCVCRVCLIAITGTNSARTGLQDQSEERNPHLSAYSAYLVRNPIYSSDQVANRHHYGRAFATTNTRKKKIL
jgi:hypothetical protein